MKILIAFFICGLLDIARSDDCSVDPTSYNLARYGRVCQSSTFSSVPRPSAECAVDGISETNHTIHPCTCTNLQYEPCWWLDMEESYFVGLVVVVLRQDNCWNCLEGAQIRIGNSADHNNPVCAEIKGVSRSEPVLKYFCNGMQGRYVSIIHAGHSGIVSLCEIKVYQYIPPEQQVRDE